MATAKKRATKRTVSVVRHTAKPTSVTVELTLREARALESLLYGNEWELVRDLLVGEQIGPYDSPMYSADLKLRKAICGAKATLLREEGDEESCQ